MFFDMGPLEMLAVLVIAIVVLGPEKLPKAISEASAFIRKVRSFSDTAQAGIRRELGPEFSDLRLSDLQPRSLAERALAGTEDEAGLREFKAAFDFGEPADPTDVPAAPEPADPRPLPPAAHDVRVRGRDTLPAEKSY